MMNFVKKIIFFYYREYKLNLSGFQDILTNITFFFLSIFIFIFSIGPNKQTLSVVGIGIVWTLLLLSSTLSLKKFYQDDFENGNLIILHINGLSFEFIAILKHSSILKSLISLSHFYFQNHQIFHFDAHYLKKKFASRSYSLSFMIYIM